MQDILDTVIEDTQTSVTSLLGAVGGAAAGRVGDMIIMQFGGFGGGIGGLGLTFVTQAATASLAYALVSRAAPATSSNVLFGYLFFVTDHQLTRSGASLGHAIVNMFLGGFNSAVAPPPVPVKQQPQAPVYAPGPTISRMPGFSMGPPPMLQKCTTC